MSSNNYPWSAYIAWAIIGNKLYAKIGYAANALHRVEGWAATGTPAPIHHVIVIRCPGKEEAVSLEKEFHRVLDEYKIIREWFAGKSVFGEDLYSLAWGYIGQTGEWWDDLCIEIYDAKMTKRFQQDGFYQAMDTRVFAPYRTWMLTYMVPVSEKHLPGWIKHVYGSWSPPEETPDVSVRYQLIPV